MAWSLIELVEHHQGPIKAATLAKWLGVTRKTVYEMFEDGRIPILNDGCSVKRTDPHTYAFVLRKRNPLMREAHRKS